MNDLAAERIAVERDEDDRPSFFANLPVILKQRKWLVMVPLWLLSLAGLAAAFLFPTTYRSSAVLLVESQELPKDLVGTPATAVIDERIERIRQQVLSRGDLITLIQQHGLYPEERRTKPLSKIIDTMREDTAIEAVSADIGKEAGGEAANTIAFKMSFDYKEPGAAQLVMQEFVNRFLELDASEMTQQAASTVSFLEDQASALQQQIAAVESQLTGIKSANGAALSSAGLAPMSNAGTYSAQIIALQGENAQLMREASRPVAKDPVLANAEGQLAATLAKYSDTHPDVKLARQRLAEARRLASANAQVNDNAGIRAQIAANNQQIAMLQASQAGEAAQVGQVMSAQTRAPAIMEQAAQMESRADTLREQYPEVSAKLMSARSAARMEDEQRGERLAVIDPPVVPDAPHSPNRTLLILAGVVLGWVTGLGLALLAELLLRPIRGVYELEQLFGAPPLVVVPTMGKKPKRRFALPKLWRRR